MSLVLCGVGGMRARVRAERPRLLSVPREVSAASMLLISGVGGLVLARPSPGYFILGLSVLTIHFFTFDLAFYALRARDTGLFLVSVIINVVPYIVVLAYNKPSLLALGLLGAALLLLVAHLVVEKVSGPGSELEYIVGSSIPVLPAATIPSILGLVNRWVAIYWLLLTIYVVATAAYVEGFFGNMRDYSRISPSSFGALGRVSSVIGLRGQGEPRLPSSP